MAVEIISLLISTKFHAAKLEFELVTPGSAVRRAADYLDKLWVSKIMW